MPSVLEGPAEEEDAIIGRLPSAPQSPVTILAQGSRPVGSDQRKRLRWLKLERARLKAPALKEHGVGGPGC